QHQLLPSPGATLLAISGGVDSVVMAHLFYQVQLPFDIAHCNFNLRGASSNEDEAWVQALAQKYQVDFYTKTFDTLTYSRSKGISIQMAARELRYAWFQKLCEEHGFEQVATAHHGNDSLETALLNLTKGTGIAGLKGVAAVQGRYIRPLLSAGKADIIAYAKAEGLSWREDSSNQKDDYQRNLLRNQVIPRLQAINPNLEVTFRSTAERLSQVGALFDEQVATLREQLCSQQGHNYHITVRSIQDKPWAGTVLWELLKPFGFRFTAIQGLLTHNTATGTHIQSPSHRLFVDRGQWIITPYSSPTSAAAYSLQADTTAMDLPNHTIQCAQISQSQYRLVADKTIAALDQAQLHFPLTVRRWQPGDVFYPLGMQQSKKLSDFLIDSKVPRPLKAQIWVVTSQEEIVWVVGHRIDDRFKVTDRTKQVYELRLSPLVEPTAE
ncbi:MAG: tRNA lysidine(34) synthetase TilS, partial [Bacteroidota bacterium]